MPESHRFLPHERAALLLSSGLAVALALSGRGRVGDFALLGIQGAGFLLLRRIRPSGRWWQLRMWLPFAALIATYFWLGDAIPRFREWRADEALWGIDRKLLGDCLSLRLLPAVSPALRELLSAAYLSFFPLWIGGYLLASRRGGNQQVAYISGIHLIHAIGFAGYALFPAAGPFRYPPLASRIPALADAGFFTSLNQAMVRNGCNGVDVFPSLHTAITLFVLLSACSWSRRAAAWLAIPCLLIVCATIGLQYHYAADLVGGCLLGAGVWAFTASRAPIFRHEDVPGSISSAPA